MAGWSVYGGFGRAGAMPVAVFFGPADPRDERRELAERRADCGLGHSDANLTANIYTDVPALALHDEMAKVPWLDNALRHSLKTRKNAHSQDFVAQIFELVRVYAKQAISEGKSDVIGSRENGRGDETKHRTSLVLIVHDARFSRGNEGRGKVFRLRQWCLLLR